MDPGDTTTAVAPVAETATAPHDSTSTSNSASCEAGDTQAPGSRRWWDRRPPTVVGILGLTAVLALPLIVGLVAQREPPWFPLTDMAHIELFVRDVGTSHTPQYGPIGRIYSFNDVGNHPGPLGFYALTPVYRLLGSDGWSLQAATVSVGLAAAAVAIWLGHRRGGWPFALAVTAILALLMWGYGALILIEPWNPHLALIWWVAFLLAAWSVLCHDLAAAPVAVVAGSFCLHNHISYIPLVGAVGVVVVATLAVRLVRARHDRVPRRRLLAWLAGSAAVLALLWLPVVLQQIDPPPGEAGNLSLIAHHLQNPEDLEYSIGEATTVWIAHLDPFDIAGGDLKKPMPWAGTPLNLAGLGLLAVWLATAVLAWRRRDQAMVRMHIVVGIAALMGWLALLRLTGSPWPYLFYWAWGTAALMLLATGWTLLTLLAPADRRAHDSQAREGAGLDGRELDGRVPALRWLRPSLVGLAAVTVVSLALLTADASDVEMDDAERSWTLGQVAGPTLDRLADDPAGCGDDCRVLVTWTDEVGLGAQSIGLVAALEREGVDARMAPGMEEQVRMHRTIPEAEADLEVHLAVDESVIDEWRARDDAELVVSTRPRDPTKAETIAVFLVVPDRSAAG